MKLAANQAMSILSGLAQLDGYERASRDGGIERVVRTGFALSGKTRVAIALNRISLGAFVGELNEQRNIIIQELTAASNGSGQVQPDDFRKREKEMLESERDVNVVAMTIDDLQLDHENNKNISPTILIMISPLLSDFEKAST